MQHLEVSGAVRHIYIYIKTFSYNMVNVTAQNRHGVMNVTNLSKYK
jgi:hypothetical protein